jgi:UDP-N-acetylmuramate dehydrogenase
MFVIPFYSKPLSLSLKKKYKMLHLKENISLLPYNTFGIDVKCKYFVEYDSVEDLKSVLQSDVFKNNNMLHIGAGSNLLFLSDFNGLVLHSNIKGIEKTEENKDVVFLRVGAGEIWDDVVDFAVKNNYAGIENLSHIPGEVGAAAVQNIGAYGVEAKDVIHTVEALEIETRLIKNIPNASCAFDYRESIFKKEYKKKYIITSVTFSLQKKTVFHLEYGNLKSHFEDDVTIDLQSVRNLIIKIREEKLPNTKELGNAGSFFMNPIVSMSAFEKLQLSYPQIPFFISGENKVKIPAAWLIDSCGWKGKQIGNAGVYEKQALVLVNKGGASGLEIKNLALQIISSVKNKFGIEITPEVNMI